MILSDLISSDKLVLVCSWGDCSREKMNLRNASIFRVSARYCYSKWFQSLLHVFQLIFSPCLSCACLSWVWEHWLPAFYVGEKAERWDSNSAFPIHLGNILVLYSFMAAYHSHGNNFAKCLFLIFRKNFWVDMNGHDGHENEKKTRWQKILCR